MLASEARIMWRPERAVMRIVLPVKPTLSGVRIS